ncbi:MAG: crossover junction endodeoxyribonuclease RuvC [Oscillospiraceae bacterium]|nr:crossover junction endodeoxyribonuclease RuvC [Oscillospiraceae bacterium]MBQ8883211.1 crossover junction endodeoxyribonuclease RuvC [Oscillospiraceae bacterium]
MVILGIDPGYAIVGFGVLEFIKNEFRVLGFGAITTPAEMPFEQRLRTINEDMTEIIEKYKPDCLAIEKLFFNTNQKTVIDVAQARGVTILPAVKAGIPIYEYTPLQVKNAVTGFGRAEKKQVQEMIRRTLNLKEVPKPDDTADALGLAITHGRTARSLAFVATNTERNFKL